MCMYKYLFQSRLCAVEISFSYNGSLTWTVICLTATMFKPLIFLFRNSQPCEYLLGFFSADPTEYTSISLTNSPEDQNRPSFQNFVLFGVVENTGRWINSKIPEIPKCHTASSERFRTHGNRGSFPSSNCNVWAQHDQGTAVRWRRYTKTTVEQMFCCNRRRIKLRN
jgi:hypothetical protein